MTAAPTSWLVDRVALPYAQATALLPLRARALDAASPRPVLHDIHARTLARRLELGLGGISPPRVGTIVRRSRVIDAWVREFLCRDGAATVVEVGVGLNTRFERLDNGTLRWLDLDLPPIIELRRAHLPVSARREHVAASADEEGWLDRVALSPRPYCIVLEAVLAYLAPAAWPRLVDRVVERLGGATLIVDAPRTWSEEGGVRALERWGAEMTLEDEAPGHCLARFRLGRSI